MKLLLQYSLVFFPLSIFCQTIQWVNIYNPFYTKINFYKSPDRISLAGFSDLRLVTKNGTLDNAYSLSPSMMSYDFLRKNGNYYFAGTSPGLTEYRFSSNLPNGQVAWNFSYTSTAPYNNVSAYYPETRALTITDHLNYLYVAGIYSDSMAIGGSWLYGSLSLLTKIQPLTGNIIWAKSIPGRHFVPRTYNLNKFVLGLNISIPTNFDSIQITPTTNHAVVIAEIDTNCSFSKAKLIGEGIEMEDIVIDKYKNFYLGGTIYPQCKIGSIAYPNQYGGLFILKTDSNSNILWSKVIYGTYFAWGNKLGKLHVSDTTELYATGWQGSDTLYLPDTTLIKNGFRNSILLKYSSSGQRLFSVNLKDSNDNIGCDVTSDDNGDVYWTGFLNGAATIGTSTINGPGSYLIKFSDFNIPVSVQEKSLDFFKVYPIPTFGNLNIEAPLNSKIELTNMYSKTVYRSFQLSNTVSINTRGMDPGIYFLSVSNNTKKQIKKVVIQ